MIPRTKIGKFIAVLWLIACVGLLLFAYIQRDIHDMPIGFTWLMIIITAPVGFIVAPIVGITTNYLSEIFGLAYHPFLALLPSWFIMVAVGYIQWFVALPKLFSWAKSKWQGS